MHHYRINEIEKSKTRPGFIGSFVHGDRMTLAHWVIEKGAPLALHAHENEQILYVIEGHLHFDEPSHTDVKSGEGIVFSPNETHGGTAFERTVCIDIFSPVREDFKKMMQLRSAKENKESK